MDRMSRDDAIATIATERQRQITAEGWTPEHDDQHSDGQMLRAAVMYFQHAARPDFPLQFESDGKPIGWPWEREWWKPKNKVRDLTRAGALCMAERDRISRQKIAALREAGDRRLITTVSSSDWWPSHVRHKFNMIVSELQAS